jgi:hypothetical protein
MVTITATPAQSLSLGDQIDAGEVEYIFADLFGADVQVRNHRGELKTVLFDYDQSVSVFSGQ